MHLPWRGQSPGIGPAISTSLLPEEGAKLAELAKGVDVLEIGSAFGFSTISMALAGGFVTSIDPHTPMNSYGQFMANVGAYNVSDHVRPIIMDSWLALPELVGQPERFDLIFIDGDHRAPAVEWDITHALRLLKPGGTIACHDYEETCCCPDVRPVVERFFPNGPDDIVGSMFVVRP